MQIFRDGQRIRSQRRQARLLTAAGVLLLVGVLIVSNVMTSLAAESLSIWLIVSYGGLIAGFICFNAGLQGLAKWSEGPARPRRDKVIDNHLRQLNDRFAIFHFAKLAGGSYDHLVVHPGGVTLLVSRDNFGRLRYEGGRWKKQASVVAKVFNFAGPPVGNPHGEAASQLQAMGEWLHAQGMSAPVDAAIVFTSPRLELTVADESPVAIVPVRDLSGLLHERAATNVFAGNQRLQLIKLLNAAMPNAERGVSDGRGSTGKAGSDRKGQEKPGQPKRPSGPRQR